MGVGNDPRAPLSERAPPAPRMSTEGAPLPESTTRLPYTAPSVLCLLFVAFPFVLFNIILLIMGLLYHNDPLLSLSLCGILTVVGLSSAFFPIVYPMPSLNKLFAILEARLRPGRMNSDLPVSAVKKANRRLLQVLFGDLAFLGFAVGLYGIYCGISLYNHYGPPAWSTLGGETVYKDVDPRSAAQSYLDAGELHFMKGTRVDSTRAIAYTSGGTTFCVAPVMVQSEYPVIKVDFWSVGINCCRSSRTFACYDSSLVNSNATVVLDTPVRPSFNSLFLEGPPLLNRGKFLDAISMAESTYGIISNPDPMLVLWTVDASAISNTTERVLVTIIEEVVLLALLAGVFGYVSFWKAPKTYEEYLSEDRVHGEQLQRPLQQKADTPISMQPPTPLIPVVTSPSRAAPPPEPIRQSGRDARRQRRSQD